MTRQMASFSSWSTLYIQIILSVLVRPHRCL
jgi:hypothetical protein